MAGCATIDKPIKMQNNGSATARGIDDMPFQLTRLASGMRAGWATASALGSRTYRKFFRPGQSVKNHSGSLSRGARYASGSIWKFASVCIREFESHMTNLRQGGTFNPLHTGLLLDG